MNTILSFLKRHPFATFVLLTYLLSWSLVIPTGGLLMPWGPMLAALIVVAFTQGRAGVKAWWKRVKNLGARPGWFGVAVAIPVVITFTAVVLNLLFGARLPQHIDWTTPFRALPLLLVVSGMWEEPGWTGYALPHQLERFAASRYGTLVATLIVAAIRTGWHLPLMLYGHIYWSDLVMVIAFQIVFSWLFKSSRNNVIVVMLCHLVNNAIVGNFVLQLFSGTDWVQYFNLQAVLWSGLAVGVLILVGPNLVRRTSSAPAEVAPTSQPVA